MTRPTSPFKFLDAYAQEDADIFFGREKETEALYDALSGVKHLLVYGPSGAGKTSLIECGLRNQFSDADWHALTIRRGDDMTAAVFAGINDALHRKMELNPETGLPNDESTDFGQAIENLFAERYQPVYLLFDQFEELLISGREEEKRDFFIRLHRLIRYKVPCRVMLVMREEFIGHLSEFEPLCSSIFQHRFRLEKMRRTPVQAVIFNMLEAPRYAAHFRVDDPTRLAETILSKLPDQRQEIELAHVQVFLGELWERAAAAGKNGALPLLHQDLVRENDNLESVLDSFLNKQLKELEPAHGDKAPLELLACMISERHTKLQLNEADMQLDLQAKGIALKRPLPELLRELETRRIVRPLKAGERTQYEISHDVLALVVGQNLTDEMKLREKAADIYRVYEERLGFFSQEDLDLMRPYREYKEYPVGLEGRIRESEAHIVGRQAEELEQTRKQLKRVRKLFFMIGTGLIVAAYFGWIAKNANKKANKLTDAYFFYDDKFALAFKGASFYFMDRNGDSFAKLGKWDNAEQFDIYTGYARVIKRELDEYRPVNYLLDTLGNTYRVAFDSRDISNKISAIDLSRKEISTVPDEVFSCTHLRLLILNDNRIDSIPFKISRLKHLEKLVFTSNSHENQRSTIQLLLPNCEIIIPKFPFPMPPGYYEEEGILAPPEM
ncbi:MAG: AAA family ATPase [Saprospiraceae bacterium]|nr:AAA family ATPase [Saprospiraceae bacterium]MCF8251153.1 AAA family ATPase [Saprospiraceae bacterium]MCF8281876.1 AAA family ATPase [Bacteroidales bacterium]MCF8312965.1 AAA family ATPase [Saprospiraceae bacterium]MCF8441412.1 AAA family ATPase [Saprospiraceae bacterium]